MKNFEEQFINFDCESILEHCDCRRCDEECRLIAEYWWRAAYESILKEIDSRVSPNISEIARIIKKELENHNEKL